MGHIGSRKQALPEIIRKYTEAQWVVLNNFESSITKAALELYDEVQIWWSDFELYDKEDYPNLKFRDLLPEKVVKICREYYKEL
jgi:hypothetical protein